MRIVLASASPRRKELLRQMGLNFDIIPSTVDEDFPSSNNYKQIAMKLAFDKAMDVALRINDHHAVVIGADTIVVSNGVLGKPKDRDEAIEMLSELQGRTHQVITGLAVINTQNRDAQKAFETTLVEMAPLTIQEIEKYVDTGEPMDKAGAYGIQGLAGLFVSRIQGCYFNVVGLPIHRLWTMLKKYGINPVLSNYKMPGHEG